MQFYKLTTAQLQQFASHNNTNFCSHYLIYTEHTSGYILYLKYC